MGELFYLLEKVEDEKTLLKFIKALEDDWKRNNKDDSQWKNITVGHFLGSIYEWGVTSVNGTEFYQKPDNIWRRIADLLYMGKIYE